MDKLVTEEIIRIKEIMGIPDIEVSKDLIRLVIQKLHEGVRMIPVKAILNESNMGDYAKKEIEMVIKNAEKNNDKAIIADFVPEILSLIEKFADSGQSGGSAPYTAGAITQALKKLLMFEPLMPVTNEDDDWMNQSLSSDEEIYQHRRCSPLFKKGKKEKPYFIDAIVFKSPNNATFTGSAKTKDGKIIRSRQYVKKFPFEPKTFVVDVDEKEIKPDDWESYIKDENQLKDVWEYYDRFED